MPKILSDGCLLLRLALSSGADSQKRKRDMHNGTTLFITSVAVIMFEYPLRSSLN